MMQMPPKNPLLRCVLSLDTPFAMEAQLPLGNCSKARPSRWRECVLGISYHGRHFWHRVELFYLSIVTVCAKCRRVEVLEKCRVRNCC